MNLIFFALDISEIANKYLVNVSISILIPNPVIDNDSFPSILVEKLQRFGTTTGRSRKAESALESLFQDLRAGLPGTRPFRLVHQDALAGGRAEHLSSLVPGPHQQRRFPGDGGVRGDPAGPVAPGGYGALPVGPQGQAPRGRDPGGAAPRTGFDLLHGPACLLAGASVARATSTLPLPGTRGSTANDDGGGDQDLRLSKTCAVGAQYVITQENALQARFGSAISPRAA